MDISAELFQVWKHADQTMKAALPVALCGASIAGATFITRITGSLNARVDQCLVLRLYDRAEVIGAKIRVLKKGTQNFFSSAKAFTGLLAVSLLVNPLQVFGTSWTPFEILDGLASLVLLSLGLLLLYIGTSRIATALGMPEMEPGAVQAQRERDERLEGGIAAAAAPPVINPRDPRPTGGIRGFLSKLGMRSERRGEHD